MELSSAQKNDILKSNKYTRYVHGTNNINISNASDTVKKCKSTPRKCKTSSNLIQDPKMKKSLSLHNIERLDDLNQSGKDVISTSTMNIGRGIPSSDKQQISVNSELLSRIEKEKKSYEATISELVLSGETRKKEKEMLLLENKRLTETVQTLQMDVGKLRNVTVGLRIKMRESGLEVDDETELLANEAVEVIGEFGTGRSCNSLTLATVGDTNSVMSDEWLATEEVSGPDRDFLKTLSVSTLQDRILKMEEDSYCTEEELQATMQELRDLQHSLDTLNDDNRTLVYERALLLESLCEQTDNLQRCRQLNEYLKVMLLTHNMDDYPKLDATLRELYSGSELENLVLANQNEEFKQTIMSCQSECRQLTSELDSLTHKLTDERVRFSQLEERYRDELWQREQVESVLRSHSEVFGQTVGWTDCISGVLALIQQNKGQKQAEASLRTDMAEKSAVIEELCSKIRQLEESMRQGMKHKEEHEGSIDQLQAQLKASEREIYVLAQTVDIIRQKNADDVISWRVFERDLLTAIAAANSLKEDRDRDVADLEQRLAVSEQQRKQLQEKLESQKSSLASQTKDRVIVARDQNSLSNTNSVKTLIQSLEYQMKPGTVGLKQSNAVTIANHNNGTNTVPRASLTTKTIKHDITRTNTVTADSSPLKHIPESISVQKSSSFKNELPLKQTLPATDCSQILLQPLTTVVSQASSILQSVSRRNSVVTNPISEHHSHYKSSPTSSKPPSPPSTPTDTLAQLVKLTNKGSKRNALLFWCQSRTNGYPKIDITNFSSSWNDGLALCALFHSFDSSLVDFKKLADATPSNPDKSQKRINFQKAFAAAEKLGIPNTLDIETMINVERPTWNSVMNYVVEIYTYFESPHRQWASTKHC